MRPVPSRHRCRPCGRCRLVRDRAERRLHGDGRWVLRSAAAVPAAKGAFVIAGGSSNPKQGVEHVAGPPSAPGHWRCRRSGAESGGTSPRHADAGFLAEAALGRGQGDLLALVELLRLGVAAPRASTTDWVKPVTVVKRGALTPPMPLPAEKVRVRFVSASTRVRGAPCRRTRWWRRNPPGWTSRRSPPD